MMYPAIRVEIRLDGGEPVSTRARTIVVGNVGSLQAGMPLLPDAAIDDGLLDVVLLHPKRFWSWIPLALRVLSRWRRSDELVQPDDRAHRDHPHRLTRPPASSTAT